MSRPGPGLVIAINGAGYRILGWVMLTSESNGPDLKKLCVYSCIIAQASILVDRWLDFLAEFDYGIVHKSRKSNVVADALSRLVCDWILLYYD